MEGIIKSIKKEKRLNKEGYNITLQINKKNDDYILRNMFISNNLLKYYIKKKIVTEDYNKLKIGNRVNILKKFGNKNKELELYYLI